MEALILSCGTGGGHNAAGKAIEEELILRGHKAVMINPYNLAGDKLPKRVDGAYIKLATDAPNAFGLMYSLGQAVRRLPGSSPIYWANGLMAQRMEEYLSAHNYDVVIMPHLFPAEILTFLKRRGKRVPKMVFIATDYSCIPFTEETDCDYYVIPSSLLKEDFIRRGIPEDKLLPLGIPVSRSFTEDLTKAQAKTLLSLKADRNYILLSGGSMGAGGMHQTVQSIKDEIIKDPSYALIVICGSNSRLYEQLSEKYAHDSQIIPIKRTSRMAWYLKACSVFITKPGGLSSTEAAVSGVPLIHVSPIPGCESINLKFFTQNNMSLDGGRQNEQLIKALSEIKNEQLINKMINSQKQIINGRSTQDICDFLQTLIQND
mgnify:FL=1